MRRGLHWLGWSGKESLEMISELSSDVNDEKTVQLSGGRAGLARAKR